MELILEKRYFCFPIKCGAKPIKTRMILPDYAIVVSLELTKEEPDFWVYYDALFTMGKTIRILHEGEEHDLRAQDYMIFSDRPIEKTPIYQEEHRPLYHFTNARGWINDPNGMVYKNGTYHMFYQLNSFGSRWYDKGWGHARSTNLFDWEILPPALYADDNGYAISGSALFDPENRAGFGEDAWILMYSSRFGGAEERGQFQNIAYSLDGEIFHKYEGNPIMEDSSTLHFRDPKVFWYEPGKHFSMVLACGTELRFYTSMDLLHWKQTGVLDNTLINPKNLVYECPELMEYQVEGEASTRWVLTVSIDKERRVVHAIGDFNGENFAIDADEKVQEADYGKDYYAAVAWNPQQEMAGRKVLIGWMCYGAYTTLYPKLEGYMGVFTVPRELRLIRQDNGALSVHHLPVKEIKELEQEDIADKKELCMKAGDTCTMQAAEAFSLRFLLEGSNYGGSKLGVRLCYDSGEYVDICFDFKHNLVSVDRSTCDRVQIGEIFQRILTAPLENRENTEVLLLVDKGCLELYLYDGKTCLSALCFPKQHGCKVTFYQQEGSDTLKQISLKPIRRAHWKY